jgi:hypothetical protein
MPTLSLSASPAEFVSAGIAIRGQCHLWSAI